MEWDERFCLEDQSVNNNDSATTITVANLLLLFFFSLLVGGNDSVALELPTHSREGRKGGGVVLDAKKAKPPWECWLSVSAYRTAKLHHYIRMMLNGGVLSRIAHLAWCARSGVISHPQRLEAPSGATSDTHHMQGVSSTKGAQAADQLILHVWRLRLDAGYAEQILPHWDAVRVLVLVACCLPAWRCPVDVHASSSRLNSVVPR